MNNQHETPFKVAAALVSLVILGSLLSGTDFLAYYLPAAQYLARHHDFPHALLPSRVDGPFAFPPAEYLLLAPTFYVPPIQAVVIKVIAAAKSGLLFYLVYRLARRSARPDVVSWFLLVPTLVMYLFIYNTDINVLLATAATVLYYQSPRYRWLAVFLIAYGLLSKYTSWPLYALGFAAFAITRRRELPYLLIPLLALIPFFFKNTLYYHNPVFPLLYHVFNPDAPAYQDLIDEWTTRPFDWGFVRHIARGLFGGWIFSALLYRGRHRRLLLAGLALYTGVWALKMNPAASGDAVRFLLPATLVTLVALADNVNVPTSRIRWALALQLAAFVLLGYDVQTRVYAILAMGVLALSSNPRRAAAGFVAFFALIGVARLAKKHSLDPTDLGYSAYSAEIGTLESLADRGRRIFTDFYFLPLDVAERPEVIVDRSVVAGPEYLESIYGRERPTEPDYLLVQPLTFRLYRFHPDDYVALSTLGSRTLFERVSPPLRSRE